MKRIEANRIREEAVGPGPNWLFSSLKQWRWKGIPFKEQMVILTLVVLVSLGVLLMLGGRKMVSEESHNASKQEISSQQVPGDPDLWSASQLEADLLTALRRIKGVGRVEVVITLTESAEERWLFRENKEQRVVKDQTGGVTEEWKETKEPILRRGKDGAETPIRLKTEAPKIAGVLVVAEGAQNSPVRRSLWEATATVLGVPLHHVMVTPWGE